MAERRMFAKTIVESGAFYSLSVKAQALYLHMCMGADDDGFLNNAAVICRSLGLGQQVLDELVDKRFVLNCGNNIFCIKHWMINNSIQKDRYKETIYKEEKNRLMVKENKSYTDCIQNGNGMDTDCIQNGYTGKDSIGKYSLDKYSDDDINNINARMSFLGATDETIQEAMRIFNKKDYPKTSGFYQRVINTLVDDSIYNKEGYISEIARNYDTSREV